MKNRSFLSKNPLDKINIATKSPEDMGALEDALGIEYAIFDLV
jgi:hypothetical protein